MALGLLYKLAGFRNHIGGVNNTSAWQHVSTCKLCSAGELNKRLDCKYSFRVSIYTRGRWQEANDDNPQSPL